ncbi:MAG TPA: type II toxin-antitoxin system HicB family antitoxin [Candidatus Nanoarchaeia archaeon]|nr:type II toxin-antitoxin system HicB family antitoxin [Candidatus Nanoarchaeia archaeon]
MPKNSKMKVMKFKVLVEKDEDGYYVADVPELQGCHTQAKNQKELMKRVKEVIELCLEDNNPVVRKVDIREIEVPVQNSKLILA